jgi:SAC3 family protein LENG8/THP3
MTNLTAGQKANPFVRHALDVQTALATSNYHSLFLLYLNAPNMGAYIMDHFVKRERIAALVIMTKAYVAFLTSLGICNADTVDT